MVLAAFLLYYAYVNLNIETYKNYMKSLRPFHLAFPVTDLKITKKWYVDNLGCTIGRSSEEWIDFNLYGHQIVAHLVDSMPNNLEPNKVDKKYVPPMHFGVILTSNQWKKLVVKLNDKNIKYIIKPYTRFKGNAGEQHTLFIKDPCGNYLEFKAFENDRNIFKK